MHDITGDTCRFTNTHTHTHTHMRAHNTHIEHTTDGTWRCIQQLLPSLTHIDPCARTDTHTPQHIQHTNITDGTWRCRRPGIITCSRFMCASGSSHAAAAAAAASSSIHALLSENSMQAKIVDSSWKRQDDLGAQRLERACRRRERQS